MLDNDISVNVSLLIVVTREQKIMKGGEFEIQSTHNKQNVEISNIKHFMLDFLETSRSPCQ